MSEPRLTIQAGMEPRDMRVVHNTRAVDWNTCGQAAVATVLAHFRAGPFAPGGRALTDAEAIDLMLREFPPDMPLGLGTSAFRIRAALRRHGLDVEHAHSGWFGAARDRAIDRLRDHLASGAPAIICLDQGLLGGLPWSAHWSVAVGHDDEGLRLAAGETLARDAFLRAWRCRHLPYTHNHCALLARA